MKIILAYLFTVSYIYISYTNKFITMRLKDKLYESRVLRRVSQEVLGKHIGVGNSYISMLENGKRPNPSFGLLLKISQAYGISLSELLKDVDSV